MGCSPRWWAVGEWGGGSGLTLRHDWRGNGLMALPCSVDFAVDSHPSTSFVGKERLDD